MQSSRNVRASSRWVRVVALAVTGVSSVALAQVSGTWSEFTGSTTNWSDPTNWVGSSVPDGGGVATFGTAAVFDPGYIRVVTLDISPTVSQINIASSSPYLFEDNGSGNTINLAAGGGTINVTQSAYSTLFSTDTGSEFTVGISGGALTKTGSGTVTLAPTLGNTYVGGTTINGGTLFVGSDDSSLGATGPGNDITINGGTLGALGSLTTSRNLNIGANGGTLQPFGTMTFNGNVTGTTTLVVPFNQNGAVVFTGSNAFSGKIATGGGTISLSGASGSFAGVSSIALTGTLILDNSVTSNNNRLASNVAISLNGSTLVNNSAASVTQSVGAITLNSGTSIIQLNSTGGTSALQAASLATANGGTVFVAGTSLGTPGSTSSSFTVATAPTLIGGGGAAGTPTISILPYATGNVNASAATYDAATAFLTYSAGSGFRPLASNEYASITATGNTRNVFFSGFASLGSTSYTMNSLTLSVADYTTGYQTSIAGTGTLTITSGGILATSATSDTGGAAYVQNKIAFGTATGYIDAQAEFDTGGVISGSGGVVKSGPGFWTAESTASTFTGQMIINDGAVFCSSNLTASANTALGNSATPVVLSTGDGVFPQLFVASVNFSRGTYSTTATMSRGLSVVGGGEALLGNGVAVGLATNLTVSGAVALGGTLDLDMAGGTATFTGTISGTGALTDQIYSDQWVGIFNASNTYSGGTFISFANWEAGNNAAFGTGKVTFDQLTNGTNVYNGTITASGTGVRSLANTIVINGEAVFSSGTGTLALTGTVDLNGHNETIAATGTVTVSGTLTDGGLIFAGPGKLILTSSSNSYLGENIVTAGTLQLGNGGTTGNISSTPIFYGVSLAATGTVAIDLSSNYYAGGYYFYGDGTFAQTGSGTTYILGTNPLTGQVNVTAGTLQLGLGTASGDFGNPAAISVSSTGTLVFDRTDAFAVTSVVSGAGTVSQTGTGTIYFTGSNSLTGRVSVTAGTLAIGSNAATGQIGSAPVTVSGTGTLAFDRSDVVTFANGISGTGSIAMWGSGVTTLTGSLTYAGNTTVTGGTLTVTSPILTLASTLTVGTGATINLNAATSATSHVIAGNFATVTATGSIAIPVTNRLATLPSVTIIGSLNIANGSMDVGNNDLILTGTSEAAIDADIFNGVLYASGATNTLTGLAAIYNSNGEGGALYSTFDGVAVSASSVLVKFTWIGDTNGDGIVNGADLSNLLAGMAGGLTGYENGDLNYDGVVDSTDLSLLLASLAGQTGSFGDSSGPTGAVPEPSAMAWGAVVLPALGRRRRTA